ncbi:hypertrehalosaemic prohormone-like [Aphis craccivora]|uniref:Hypertrehalosaemic prohormone-like n=1 Tax=Aphis craccivora TaxID=307492 RepID=A0A6G0YME0_APHCR|nr:hypertrehalosaemic prohormone-like [Aphis craccivora]
MRSLLLLAVFMLCACIVVGQVNFTPTWGQGKRNAPASDECKSMDTLIYIYKLVQVKDVYNIIISMYYECDTGL